MIGVGMPTHLAPRLYVKWSKQISVLYCSLQLSLWMLSEGIYHSSHLSLSARRNAQAANTYYEYILYVLEILS